MLAEIVIDDEHIVAIIHERLGDGAPRIGGQIHQRGRVIRGGHHHHRVIHRARLLQGADDLQRGRLALADADVDADHIGVALIDDRIQGDARLARLPVTDDQLALPAPNGHDGIDGLDPGV